MPSSLAPSVAHVDLSALTANLATARARSGVRHVMAVVKANAYGHGAVPVARHLEAVGANAFGVATLPEAVALREAGIAREILVFAAPLPDQLPHYVRHGLSVTVTSVDVAEAVARAGGPLRAHVKVDTGMGRIGLAPSETPAALRALDRPGVTLAGIWTHFATADEPGHALVALQLDRFSDMIRALGGAPAPVHLANSGGVFVNPDRFRGLTIDGIRIGIALYGILEGVPEGLLQPAMTWTAPITQIKTVEAGTPISYGATWQAPTRTRIGTVATGYADGYRRAFSNRASVGFAGRLIPVAGRVCMDMFMVDLGAAETGPKAAPGDRVVLMGRGGPSARLLAQWADTITYEITCGITARVHRTHGDGPPDGHFDAGHHALSAIG